MKKNARSHLLIFMAALVVIGPAVCWGQGPPTTQNCSNTALGNGIVCVQTVNPALVGETNGQTSVSFTKPYAAGDLLVAVLWSGGSRGYPTVSQSGNSWYMAAGWWDTNVQHTSIWYAYNSAAGSNPVIVQTPYIWDTVTTQLFEYSGVLTSFNPLDAVGVSTKGSAADTISTSTPTSEGQELAISALVTHSGGTATVGSPWLLCDWTYNDNFAISTAAGLTGKANTHATARWINPQIGDDNSMIVTFKSASGGRSAQPK